MISSNSMQYEAYHSQGEPVASASVPSSAPAAPVVPEVKPEQPEQPKEQPKQEPEAAKQDDVMSEAAIVSPPPQEAPQELPIVSKEERIEYRDENGRILDDEEVKALAGKVSFKTRYETRTRVIDEEGNEVYEGLVDAHGDAEEAGVAPPHPDAEGRNPETREAAEAQEASEAPPTVEAVQDQQKEKSIERQQEAAQPASEAKAATQHAEL